MSITEWRLASSNENREICDEPHSFTSALLAVVVDIRRLKAFSNRIIRFRAFPTSSSQPHGGPSASIFLGGIGKGKAQR